MLLAGADVDRLRITGTGPVIEYHGGLSPRQEMGIAAAGPASGLLFASVCAALGTPYFRYAGLVALLSSAFNLLPALPLDGGHLALAALRTSLPETDARRILRISGIVCGLCAAVTGAFLRSVWAFGVGIWLAVLAVREDLR